MRACSRGDEPAPPEGTRVDIEVEGTSVGILEGTINAVDYVVLRADGRADLHIHGYATLPDGTSISVAAVGVATPLEDNRFSLAEFASLHCGDERYSWVNTAPIRAEGVADMVSGKLSIQGYLC